MENQVSFDIATIASKCLQELYSFDKFAYHRVLTESDGMSNIIIRPKAEEAHYYFERTYVKIIVDFLSNQPCMWRLWSVNNLPCFILYSYEY